MVIDYFRKHSYLLKTEGIFRIPGRGVVVEQLYQGEREGRGFHLAGSLRPSSRHPGEAANDLERTRPSLCCWLAQGMGLLGFIASL